MTGMLGRCPYMAFAAPLLMLSGIAHAASPALVAFISVHADPSYIVQHMVRVESRPFDGLVVNDYLGRNLFNTHLRADSPAALDASGVVTYEAAARGLAPLQGAFHKFTENFVKVDLDLIGPPPLLADDAGWQIVLASAANYARAVQTTGLRGIFFDNEGYLHPPLPGRPNGADYWRAEDQAALSGRSGASASQAVMVALARRRGRELMQAFARGYPAVTVIVAHGPSEGCGSWQRASGHFAVEGYLLGAFAAGMVEGTPDGATFVDGGEDYDWRAAADFTRARAWRRGDAHGGITSTARGRCPFMDDALAAVWHTKVSIAFSTFDKERASLTTNNWTAITNTDAFRGTLTNALRASDRYVWHYTEWQDWWGDTMEASLKPWIAAIEAARRDAGISAP